MVGALHLSGPQGRFSPSFLVIADPKALPAVSMLTAPQEIQAGFKAHGSPPYVDFYGEVPACDMKEPNSISHSIRYDRWFLSINMSGKGGRGLPLAASFKIKENALPELPFLSLLTFCESAGTSDHVSAKDAKPRVLGA